MPAFSAPLHVRDNVPLPSVRLPAIATMCRLHAQDVAPLSHVHSTACTKRSSDSCGTRAMASKMLARCVPQRPTVTGLRPNALLAWLAVAIFSRGAFSGALSRQDSAAVRSRALADGKILAKCVPGRQSVANFALHASRKRPRTGKSPARGKIRAPCIRNELAMAGYARYASEKPRKPPFGNARREDLARKGHFSLHGPLESCTARESCHPLTLDLSEKRYLR